MRSAVKPRTKKGASISCLEQLLIAAQWEIESAIPRTAGCTIQVHLTRVKVTKNLSSLLQGQGRDLRE